MGKRLRQPTAVEPTVSCGDTAARDRMRSRGKERAAGCSGRAKAKALHGSTAIKYAMGNPKVPGTAAHARYQRYCVAQTVAEAQQLGALPEDLRHDRNKGYLRELKVPGRRLSGKQAE